MKLNYRDRIILLIVLAIAILAVGFFAAVRPLRKSIKNNSEECKKVKQQWEDMDAEIQKIPGLQNKINEMYDKSMELCEDFADQNTHSYEIDKQFQEYADKCHLQINDLEVTEPGEAELGYYFEEPVLLRGSMYDAADINGNYIIDYNTKNADVIALGERTAETIIAQQYAIKANGSKQEIWDYMQAIADIDETVMIDSVNISDYYFGLDPHGTKELQWQEDPETKRVIPVNADKALKEGYSDVTIIATVYSVIPLDKPVVE